MKRLFSILLAAALLLGNLPVGVFAEETNAEPVETTASATTETEPAETESAETTAPAETESAETTAPAETESAETTAPAETESAETTAPAETESAETTAPAETEPAETTESQNTEVSQEAANSGFDKDSEKHQVRGSLSLSDVLDDSDKMLEGYVREIFYGSDKTRMSPNGGRNSLNAKEREMYDGLSELVVAVADGYAFRTVLDGRRMSFTAADLGVHNLWAYGDISDEAVDSIFAHFRNALFAVLEDHPYESFWISKEVDMAFGFNYRYSGDTISIVYYFELPVASAYAKAGGELSTGKKPFCVEVDPYATRAGSTSRKAADYAKSIVNGSASMEDWDRLHYYKEVVCDLVEYDHHAADIGPKPAVGSSPWQLINVFDQDPTTNVVCEGYSKAFQYLCDLTTFNGQVRCYQDTGNTVLGASSGLHMWNMVEINGHKLLADVTNSDTGTIGYDGHLFLTLVNHIYGGFRVDSLQYKQYKNTEGEIKGCKYVPDEYTDPVFVPEKKATCTENGMKAHYIDGTGRLYIEVDGRKEYVRESDLVILATGEHIYDHDQDPICNVCGLVRKVDGKNVPIFRLYNPVTSEHLMCNDVSETNSLLKGGWSMDGIAWYSVTEGKTVYRLYNRFDGSHLYTMDQNEINNCQKIGWTMDGPVSYSAPAENGRPIYRLYNPNVKRHYHLYTADQKEIDTLTPLGWKLEGIAWYAAK